MDPFPRWLKLTLGVVLLALLAAGVWLYEDQTRRRKQDAWAEVQAIGQLKVAQIAAWRAERLADAAVLTESPFLREAVARWLANRDPADTAAIRTRLRSIQEHNHYRDLLLVDSTGQVRLSLGAHPGPLHVEAAQAFAAASRTRQPVLTDLHKSPGQNDPHLSVVAPVFADNGPEAGAGAAVVLECDARQFLYPLIQSWPTPSRTAETLLVRRDGDEVLFLNDLRHQRDAALSLRLPLTRTNVPAVMAVLGRTGVVEGRDYRGVAVLSVLQPVPDSPWFMVAKVDRREALAALRREAVLILALLGGLALAVVASAGLVWHRHGKANYRARFEAEQRSRRAEARHRVTLMSVGDGVITTDAGGNVDLLNAVAERLTGWPATDAGGQPLAAVFGLVNEETCQPVDGPVARVLSEGQAISLASHSVLLAKDGSRHPVAGTAAPVRDESGTLSGTVLVFRDLTAERRQAHALTASETRYRRLFEAAKDGILILDVATGAIVDVNPFLFQLLGFPQEYFLGRKLWELGLFKDIAASQAAFVQLQENQYVRYEDLPLSTGDGRQIAVEFVSNVYAVDGQKVIQCNIRDITARKQQEAAVQRLNRTLGAISHIRRAVMSAPDEADFLRAACRIVVEACGHKMAWIGFAEADPAQSVRPVAHYGFEEGYLETLNLTWADTERGRGPTGTAIRTGAPAACRNMLTDPAFAPWRAEAVKRGYASSIVLPLLDGAKVVGAISIYSAEPDPFAEAEVRLLTELAEDLAQGIAACRERAARVRAEAQLRESQQRLQQARDLLEAVMAGSRVLIATVDRELRYTFFNEEHHRELKRLTGKDTTIGLSLLEMLADMPAERDKALAVWGRALNGETVVQTLVFGDPGRYRRWYNTRHTPIRDAAGAVVGAGEVTSDITELMQAQEAQRESEERFRALAENAPDQIMRFDRELRLLYANPAVLRRLGLPATALVGRTAIEYGAAPTAAAGWETAAREVLARGEVRRFEYASEWQGERRISDVQVAPEFDDAGVVRAVIAIARDITERKAAEAALAQERDSLEIRVEKRTTALQLAYRVLQDEMAERDRAEAAVRAANAYNRGLIEVSLDPLVTVGPDGKIIDVNTASEQVTGRRRGELIGTEFATCFTDPARAAAGYRQVFDHGLVRDLALEIRHRDGHVTPVLYNASIYRDEAGQVVGVLAAARDITALEQAHRRLRESESRLRQLAARLTAIREDERTRIARQIHDGLGHALTALKLDIALLGKRLVRERRNDLRTEMQERCAALCSYLDQTIGATRNLVSELRPPVLDEGLLAAIEWQARDFTARTGIVCQLAAEVPAVDLPPERATAIFRIFQEALTNVARHAEALAVAIRLTVAAGAVVLTVEDNGRGITAEEAASPRSLGLLGLRERAQLLGGAVEIRGVPGRGTTVTARVPCESPAPAPAPLVDTVT